MKSTLTVLGVISVFGFSMLGTNIASARGMGMFRGFSLPSPDEMATRQQATFQNEANLLGLSLDEVKNGWAQGKSFQQIAKDHNITDAQIQQKMKDTRTADQKAQFKALVDKGIITQTQADQRFQAMQNLQTQQAMPKKSEGRMERRGGGGMRGWFHF